MTESISQVELCFTQLAHLIQECNLRNKKCHPGDFVHTFMAVAKLLSQLFRYFSTSLHDDHIRIQIL